MAILLTCRRSMVCLMYMHSRMGILGDTAVKTKLIKSCTGNKVETQQIQEDHRGLFSWEHMSAKCVYAYILHVFVSLFGLGKENGCTV